MALFVEYFWVIKFLFLFEGENIVRQWGSGDDVTGWVWGVPWFKDIPLGFAKVPGSGFLGFVTSGLLNLQNGGFFNPSRVLSHSLLKLIPIFCLFACRMARGHKETSTSQAGCKSGTPPPPPPGNAHGKQASHC